MSIIDDLRGKADFAQGEADRYRGLISDHEATIKNLRERIDVAELEAVGATVAANILEGIDLTVDREDGKPRVRFAALDPKP